MQTGLERPALDRRKRELTDEGLTQVLKDSSGDLRPGEFMTDEHLSLPNGEERTVFTLCWSKKQE